MKESIPYAAKYAIGLLIVMSVHMLFNVITTLSYPEHFDYSDYPLYIYVAFFAGTCIWEAMLALLLFLRSGISYKFTIISLIALMLLNLHNILIGGHLVFDISIQALLSIVSLIALMPKSVRSFYNNWSLGDLPEMEL